MSFVGEVLQNVDGIQYFYIVGMLIFIVLFGIVVFRTVKMPRKDLIDIKTSIFEKDDLEAEEISRKS